MDIATLKPLCERCKHLALNLKESEEKQRLLNMINTLLNNVDWPDLKIGKWLGYIEGVLIEKGITTVNVERDFSRPIYHAYYKSIGVDIPATTDVMNK